MTWRRGIRSFYHKLRVGVRALLPALFLAALSPAWSVSAEDILFQPVAEEDIIHNEQEITYDDIDSGENGGEGFDTYTNLSDTVKYYPDRDWYVESFGTLTGSTVTSNIPNGLYTNEPVSLSLGSEIEGILYRDGEECVTELSEISEPGNYCLRLSDLNGNDLGSFSFRITDVYTNTSGYKIPENFYVYEVLRDGVSVESGSDTVAMTEEGEYLISVRNDRIEKDYYYRATVDHTAPTLLLSELNENNIAKTEVDISDLESGTELLITYNDEVITNRSTLTAPGRYVLMLTDPAGNITIYQFTIYMYLNVSGTVVLIGLGLAILALLIYLIVARRKQRVR